MNTQPSLFTSAGSSSDANRLGATSEQLKRLDSDQVLREALLPHCRLKPGDVWEDPIAGHRVGVLDSTDPQHVKRALSGARTRLVIGDPPYNIAVGNAVSPALPKTGLGAYLEFSRAWITNALEMTDDDAHLYIWLGADYRGGFQPLPDVMILLRSFKELRPRNLITLRNQRGYGTQKTGCGSDKNSFITQKAILGSPLCTRTYLR